MIDLETASAWKASRSFLTQSPRKRAATAVVMLSLVAAFIFAGAPATAAALMSNSDHVMFDSDPPRCPGEKPGMCPD